LFQALPYMPCLAKETNHLIANWSIVGISLAYVVFVILWYKHQHAKKNPPKSTRKTK